MRSIVAMLFLGACGSPIDGEWLGDKQWTGADGAVWRNQMHVASNRDDLSMVLFRADRSEAPDGDQVVYADGVGMTGFWRHSEGSIELDVVCDQTRYDCPPALQITCALDSDELHCFVPSDDGFADEDGMIGWVRAE